jgi:predicted MFS family arabinose efflux permease
VTLTRAPSPRELRQRDDGGAAGPPPPARQAAGPSRSSQRGLDWFTFFVADVQTGFGPFISVYLTSKAWTQVDIGLVLTIRGLIALAGQIPGGAIVDYARSERFVAVLAIGTIGVAALALALWPVFPVVLAAEVLHAAASCVLGPALAAISLGLVGHAAIGERLGRNARFASIGAGLSAALMGAVGYYWSNQSVFFVTALLVVPAMLALTHIRTEEIDPVRAHGGISQSRPGSLIAGLRQLAGNRALLLLAGTVLLFHLANAAMLPLMGSLVTMRSSQWATVLVAACMVVPQVLVAVFSPMVGVKAQQWGRRPLLLLGLGALPLRGLFLAILGDPDGGNPATLVVVQLFDGVSAAVMGVMVPLVVADVTRGTGRFNLAQGVVGCAMGIGASLSTTLAGAVADLFGYAAAFLTLAGVATAGFLLVLTRMPETRPPT